MPYTPLHPPIADLAPTDNVLTGYDEQLKIALREDFPKLNKLRATRVDQIHLRFKAKELAVRTALETAVAALLDREQRERRLATELEAAQREREEAQREREAAQRDREAAEKKCQELQARLDELELERAARID